ncbi:hypothetical protein [Roseateles sp. L2-2]|uniref:hypothetical protein n=1 Tax=Roseateles TaxID=93681 RepID=UPI003D3645C9
MKPASVLIRMAARWLSRPARSARTIGAAPLLFGALVLTGCDGGDMPSAPMTAPAARAESAAPVKAPRPVSASSGEIAYYQSLQGDRRVGMEAARDH